MRKIFFVLAMLLQSIFLHAYIVKGFVVDEKGKPIRKALVIGRNSMKKVVVGVETDPSGKFSSANVTDSILAIEISKEDYTTVYIRISGTDGEFVDLGTIELKPMEVSFGRGCCHCPNGHSKAGQIYYHPVKKGVGPGSQRFVTVERHAI